MSAPTATPQADHEAGAESLFYARAVVADLATFDDETIKLACTFILNQPDIDEEERAEVSEILTEVSEVEF